MNELSPFSTLISRSRFKVRGESILLTYLGPSLTLGCDSIWEKKSVQLSLASARGGLEAYQNCLQWERGDCLKEMEMLLGKGYSCWATKTKGGTL